MGHHRRQQGKNKMPIRDIPFGVVCLALGAGTGGGHGGRGLFFFFFVCLSSFPSLAGWAGGSLGVIAKRYLAPQSQFRDARRATFRDSRRFPEYFEPASTPYMPSTQTTAPRRLLLLLCSPPDLKRRMRSAPVGARPAWYMEGTGVCIVMRPQLSSMCILCYSGTEYRRWSLRSDQ